MDALPDPMKLDPFQVGFVIVLITLMYLTLKAMFFKPVSNLMDTREAAIQAGATKRAEASAFIDQRKAEYQSRMRDLRSKVSEHRKTLAASASSERQAILDETRRTAEAERKETFARLAVQRESAKTELMEKVEALSESIIQHLLKA
jgi:F-type H+-transporting ATPase subunit b